MSNKKEFQLVKYKSGKNTFELLTKPGSVLKYRGGGVGWNAVLFAEDIYKNHVKGEKFTLEELKSTFGSSNLEECAKKIVEKGELQLSASERKEKIDKKREEIINYIHTYYIDPKTKTTHPRVRIETAVDNMKYRINPDIPMEKQVQEIIRKMPDVGVVLKKVGMRGVISVPNQYSQNIINSIATIIQIESKDFGIEGCNIEVSFVPGDFDFLISTLNKITKGDYQFNLTEGEIGMSTKSENIGKKKKRNNKPNLRI